MELLSKGKWKIKAFLEGHPYGYYLGNKIINFSNLFLPHEEDYFGFKKLANKSQGLFLDIGANDGKSARSFRKLFKHWQIFSVEANPLHIKKLQTLKTKMRNFDYAIGAIGPGKKTLTLYTPVYKNIVIHSAASIEVAQLERQMKKQFRKKSICDAVRYIKTETKSIYLDDLNLSPDFIKIDIEGMEHIALQNLENTLDRAKPTILVEYNLINYARIKKYLVDRDYECYGFNIKTKQFETFQAHRNCFFIHKSVGCK